MITISCLFICVMLLAGILALIGRARIAGGLTTPKLSRARLHFHHLKYQRGWKPAAYGLIALANAILAAEFHEHGRVTRTLNNAVATRYLLAKAGTAPATEADLSTANTRPVGYFTDTGAAGDSIAVQLFGSAKSTAVGVASGAITAGDVICTDASGKIQTEPTSAGTYYIIGRALTATSADGDLLEYAPIAFPIKLLVIAALQTDTAAHLASDLTTAFGSACMIKIATT